MLNTKILKNICHKNLKKFNYSNINCLKNNYENNTISQVYVYFKNTLERESLSKIASLDIFQS